uniref:Uncharacterized protein n=1 Tax=Magallana gigas TaxID=29159 RepID=A0A8W8LA91_MAGGI
MSIGIERSRQDEARQLFQAIEDSNRRILQEFANLPDIIQRTVWRKDYFQYLLLERNIPVIAVIEYFSGGQNDRLLNLDISHRGLPVCQDTFQ